MNATRHLMVTMSDHLGADKIRSRINGERLLGELLRVAAGGVGLVGEDADDGVAGLVACGCREYRPRP